MISERNKELLSKQMSEEMSELERAELREALRTDEELKDFVEAFNNHNQALLYRQQLEIIRKERAFKKKWLKISIGGLGIAATFALIWFLNRPSEESIKLKSEQHKLFQKSIDSVKQNQDTTPIVSGQPKTERQDPLSKNEENEQKIAKKQSKPLNKDDNPISKKEQSQAATFAGIAYAENAEKNYVSLDTNNADYDDVNTKSPDSQGGDNVKEAIKAFKKQEYNTTVRLLPRKSVEGKTSDKRLLAHAYFKLKKYSDAKSLFKEIVDSGFGDSSDEWSLLMTYLAQYPSNKSEFDALIEKIKNNKDSEYSKKAEDLLKQMPKKN